MIRNVMWLVRLLYLPLFLLVGNGVAVYLVAEGFNAGWLGLLILVFIGISFATERLIPYDRAFNEPQQDQRRDVLHALMNESLNVIGIAVLPLIAGLLVLAPIWPSSWPLVFQLLLAILISDIGITLAHFASHRLRLLWRLHAIHHSVKRLYGFNGLMKHPIASIYRNSCRNDTIAHYRSTAECPDVVGGCSCTPVATATLECSVFYRTAEKGSRNQLRASFPSFEYGKRG